jgi:hypothetical protein
MSLTEEKSRYITAITVENEIYIQKHRPELRRRVNYLQ